MYITFVNVINNTVYKCFKQIGTQTAPLSYTSSLFNKIGHLIASTLNTKFTTSLLEAELLPNPKVCLQEPAKPKALCNIL
jgi:hypothetical protein